MSFSATDLVRATKNYFNKKKIQSFIGGRRKTKIT
jgi:hypothetical protein